MKHLLLITLVFFTPFLQAETEEEKSQTAQWMQFARDQRQKLGDQAGHLARQAWNHRYCKPTLYILGSLATASVLSYAWYNWDYSDGEWENRGTEEKPSWVPKTGPEFQVAERVSALSLPPRRSLWVNNGDKSFGHVIYEGDRIQYWHGKDLVAETNFVSPVGRPYNEDIPIRVTIKDGNGRDIGTVEEVSSEVQPGIHAVKFRVVDPMGYLVGETGTFQEKADATLLKKPLQLDVKDVEDQKFSEINRKNHLFTQSYHWKDSSAEARMDSDPRLFVILSAYKSYVDDYRE